MAWSPAGDVFAAGTYTGGLGVYDGRTYELLLLLSGTKGGLTQVRGVPTCYHTCRGRRAPIGGNDGTFVCARAAPVPLSWLLYLLASSSLAPPPCPPALSLSLPTQFPPSLSLSLSLPQSFPLLHTHLLFSTLLRTSTPPQLLFSADGNYLYTGARQDPHMLCWDVRHTYAALYSMERPTAHTNQRVQFDIEPAGRHLLTGGCDGAVLVGGWVGGWVRVAGLSQGAPRGSFRWRARWAGLVFASSVKHATSTHPIAIPPATHGRRAAPAAVRQVYDLSSGQLVDRRQVAADTVNGVGFHPTLGLLATASGERGHNVLGHVRAA